MMHGKGATVTLLAGVCGLLAACGSGGGSAASSSTTSNSLTSTGESAAGAGGSATMPTRTPAFSCDIKPGAGLLPNQTPRPGRIVASVADIESATGLSMSQSVDISEVAGITACRYQVGNGQVNITILDDPSQAQAELNKTRSQSLALADRGCNGCTLSDFTALPELGPSGYSAIKDQNPVYGSITAGTYFEVDGVGLKAVRLERLALVIAGNLSGGSSPSLPPLPTPTPSR